MSTRYFHVHPSAHSDDGSCGVNHAGGIGVEMVMVVMVMETVMSGSLRLRERRLRMRRRKRKWRRERMVAGFILAPF